MAYTSVNWNVEEDEFDEYVWDKATAQFWLDTRVPVSSDRGDWRTLTDSEKGVINKVVGGLALLDTLQSEEGVNVMREDARKMCIRDRFPTMLPKTIRQRLAKAGINAANAQKPMNLLSGGEQTKVKLALLELTPSN